MTDSILTLKDIEAVKSKIDAVLGNEPLDTHIWGTPHSIARLENAMPIRYLSSQEPCIVRFSGLIIEEDMHMPEDELHMGRIEKQGLMRRRVVTKVFVLQRQNNV